jgi:predicted O-linked N-acetylglucosamine transferase (SPINDLY family)
LPETGALYGCLQSLFKFHPDFDAVMAEVVTRDLTGWIVLVDWIHPTWRELLRARWGRTHPILLERVIFQPRQSGDRFRQLVSRMDVMLDPLHFGGGNTFYEALAQGVPTVTWPGPYLRGRLITGFYGLLGVEEGLIARNVTDFAAMAVTLATDPKRRAEICAPLMARAAGIYRDDAAVRELDAFFEAAVSAETRIPMTSSQFGLSS